MVVLLEMGEGGVDQCLFIYRSKAAEGFSAFNVGLVKGVVKACHDSIQTARSGSCYGFVPSGSKP